ncbi:uncharacterized protein (TIGR03089 family) [Arthrobacter silviterrae]|uniref:TIGR03089 family protein n=1 Tax=Arthrobacter silviterrae TaxID=2026658 RepID=A0ABX0DH90_9MICC|nr:MULTISPECIES: TIGR03089 family protein [Arthrobacter]MCU6481675.1 TIGR03089 family protein [Arthrobacter sp. A2-55]MDQ0279208.1 uncharacterized protein (TIGR03089 family) [Arthrobacter silviterrae]NGN83673.1 TIGR03089 family protein [Arthrobacter silviterrae]
MAQNPTTVTDLLQALRGTNATAPRLTWYGPNSERVELSGKVLDNWVAKTANFLVDELDAESGTVINVDVPVHWRSLVWLLATWAVGATAFTGTGLPDADRCRGADVANIVATTDPEAASTRAESSGHQPYVVAVALPALAMRWTESLPDGALDYSGQVRAHADVFYADTTPAGNQIAWESVAGPVSYAALLGGGTDGARAAGGTDIAGDGGAGVTGPQRKLLLGRDGWDGVVPSALQTWAAGGSVVLLDPSVEDTEKLRASENVSA